MVLQQHSTNKKGWSDIRPVTPRPQPRQTPVPPVPIRPTIAPTSKKSLTLRERVSSLCVFLKKQFNRLPRRVRIAIAMCCALLVAIAIYFFAQYHSPQNGTNSSPQGVASQGASGPDYPTILPEGKTIDDLGGWIRASPVDKNPVFAYADKIGTATIKVSEQPLPTSFKENASQRIEELLNGYESTEKIIAGSRDVQLGSTKNSAQSAIFYQDDLLVLITSSDNVEKDKWIDYITSLR